MSTKSDYTLLRTLFVFCLALGLVLFYLAGPMMQAKQVVKDVEHYIHLNEMTPSVDKLRRHSATFRNSNGKCPCYKQLSADQFEVEYQSRFKSNYVYDSSNKTWNQIKLK